MFSLQRLAVARSPPLSSQARFLSSQAPPVAASNNAASTAAAATTAPPTSPNTHFRITLRRSAIALPARCKATLVALGLRRRMQTVFHPHRPDIAGKILRVKELVHVQNVPARSVRSKTELRWERRPEPGFRVVASYMRGRGIGL